MATINLLPWREDLRKQQQQDFGVAIGAGVVVTCIIMTIIYMYIEGMKEYQQSRNQLLKSEIQVVNKRIKEIKDIEAKKNQLLTKIEVIQKLQESRPQIVHLFDELSKSTPEGVFLTTFQQNNNDLTFSGKAQSNGRVSAYMRAVEASAWLDAPVLKVIEGQGSVSSGRLNDFTMVAKQGVEKPKDEGGKK